MKQELRTRVTTVCTAVMVVSLMVGYYAFLVDNGRLLAVCCAIGGAMVFATPGTSSLEELEKEENINFNKQNGK